MTALSLQEPTLLKQLERLAKDEIVAPELLLIQAVNEFLERAYQKKQKFKQPQQPEPPEFLREAEAFERLKPELLKQYPGRVVAIHGGEVVEVGDDRMDVYGKVLERLGFVPCYIEQVVEETPRRVRMPSTWIVR